MKCLFQLLPLWLAFLAVPAAAQIQVNGNLSHEHEVLPGTVYGGAVSISNASEEPQQVRLYLRDLAVKSGGESNYLAPGTLSRSSADWIRLPGTTITIPALTTMPVEYALVVPETLAEQPLRGTYWSVLMVETVPKAAPERDKKAVVVFTQKFRYAIQIVAHVSGTGEAQLQLGTPQLAEIEGKRLLKFQVENIGERSTKPKALLECYDTQGSQVAIVEGPKVRFLPGMAYEYGLDVSALPPGTYQALLVLDSGTENLFGAQFRFEVPATPLTASTPSGSQR